MRKAAAHQVLSTVLLLAWMPVTPAQDRPAQPSQGMAHDAARPAAIRYDCAPAQGSRMECRFVQLNVWKPLREVATNDEQRGTCTIAAHSYVQTLRRDDSDAKAPTWTATLGPEGVCGIARESRFIGSRQSDGTVFWTYVASIKVANKSAEDGALRCWEIREQSSTFDSQWREQGADCTTVRFESACSSADFPCLGDGPIIVQ